MLLLKREYRLHGLSLLRCHHAIRFFVGRGLITSPPVGFPPSKCSRLADFNELYWGRHFKITYKKLSI